MAKLVYKGKIKGNDVVYKEGCINYHINGGYRVNLMEVVTEAGKEFRFRACRAPFFILNALEENRPFIYDDHVEEVVIKERGKATLKYNRQYADDRTVEGKRTRLFIQKADIMYNEIRRGILRDLREKPKDKKLERLLMTDEELKKEADDAFSMDSKVYGLHLYKEDTKRFIKFFSKIDKNTKKGLLNEIFSCDYENKEVIEWLNKNEQDLLREAGFNG